MPEPRPELSVVVLCYHSALEAPPFVGKLRQALDGAGVGWEMVLVTNDFAGSDDPTAAFARERPLQSAAPAADPGQAAGRAGARAAR